MSGIEVSGHRRGEGIRSRGIGFTLIELLAVIAVIGILASLLIVAVSKARLSAQAAQSASNIRQIGAATMLFANDHGGQLPKVAATGIGGDPSEFFFLMESDGVANFDQNYGLKPYVDDEDIFLASADDGLKASGEPGRNFSYSFNFLINKGELQEGNSGPTGFEKALNTLRIHLIEEPAKKVLIYEEQTPNDAFCVWFIDRPVERYNGDAHVGFADGHVQRLPAEEIFGNTDLGELVPPKRQY
jgi:prepilin-type N-terminal cleavage/methylation domain-containing protein/prepilin-type processing-associated H-X9-DG protein